MRRRDWLVERMRELQAADRDLPPGFGRPLSPDEQAVRVQLIIDGQVKMNTKINPKGRPA